MSKQFDKRQTLFFSTKPLAFERMGDKLIRVTCYLVGEGINRNGSHITKDAINKANKNLAHIPVVGNLLQDSNGDWYLGGHDYKINVQGSDWEIEPLTVPLGCVAGDKKFEWVEIEESTGQTREYLKVDLILWNNFSPVMEAAYSRDVYFNNSIEIDNIEGQWDHTNNFRIDSFEYDCTCLLGLDAEDKWSHKHTEPCFEGAQVYPTYQFSAETQQREKFKLNFNLLLDEIKKHEETNVELNADDPTTVETDPALINNQPEEVVEMAEEQPTGEVKPNDDSDVVIVGDEVIMSQEEQEELETETEEIESTEEASEVEGEEMQKSNKEEGVELSNIKFSEVCAKVREDLLGYSFRSRTGTKFDKYIILSISEADRNVVVIDREADYAAYSIPYHVSETKEAMIVNVAYDNKADMKIGVVEDTDSAFTIKPEVDMIAKDASEYDVSVHSNATIADLEAQLAEVTEKLASAEGKVTELEGHLEVYEAEKKTFMAQKHKDIVDALIGSRREEMGNFSEFLDYCVVIDYSKPIETFEKELKEIHYNYMLKAAPAKTGKQKMSFSAIQVGAVDSNESHTNVIAERYGVDMAKYFQ